MSFVPTETGLFARLTQSTALYLNPIPGLQDELFVTAFQRAGKTLQFFELDGAPTVIRNSGLWDKAKMRAAIFAAGALEELLSEQIEAVIEAAKAAVPEKSDISITLPQGADYEATRRLIDACDPAKYQAYGAPWLLSGGVFLLNADDRIILNQRSGAGNEGQLQDFSGLLDGNHFQLHMLKELNEELAMVMEKNGLHYLVVFKLNDEAGMTEETKLAQIEKLKKYYPDFYNDQTDWAADAMVVDVTLDQRFTDQIKQIQITAGGMIREMFSAIVMEEPQNPTSHLFTRTMAVRHPLKASIDLSQAQGRDPEWGERPVYMLGAEEVTKAPAVIPPMRAFTGMAETVLQPGMQQKQKPGLRNN